MTAADAAGLLARAFATYHEAFRAEGRAAATDFVKRDWIAGRERSTHRLALYSQHMARTLAELDEVERGSPSDRELWIAVRREYAALIAERPDRDIAETFFNSLTRRRLDTVGVDSEVEFAFPERRAAPRTLRDPPLIRHEINGTLGSALEPLLARLAPMLQDPVRESARVAAAIERSLGADVIASFSSVELLAPVLYRNKGAYLVGTLVTASGPIPLLIAILSDAGGPHVDAVLTTPDELSVVFGFSWSYFLADIECPAAVVAYLTSIMPQKRADELYTSLGYNRHGKTELYRALLRHLEHDDATFEEAEGVRGLVMRVFTLPSLNVVFKLIKDDIAPPKQTSWQEVRASYQFVFERDRVGRLADAQEFEQLVVPRQCMPETLLAELLESSSSSIQVEDTRVVISHCYTQRRVRPLNLYLEEAPAADAAAAVIDYGQALKDLAASDIFPGDMLTKNCGLSRHGRVIFYDFDELSTLSDRVFRHLPAATNADDELSAEPWFSVGETDVFPEQFAPFLIPAGPLADLLRERHGELFDPDWWRGVQERLASGEIFDTFPYSLEKRLSREP